MVGQRPTRIAALGCGFWSQFQIAGWQELPQVEVAAVYNRTKSKPDTLARRFGIERVYESVEQLLAGGSKPTHRPTGAGR